MRILLTGATGFIGRHVLRELGSAHDVVAVTRRAPADRFEPHVTFVQADLLRTDEVAELVRCARAETLVHLAWHVPAGSFWTSPENLVRRKPVACQGVCRAGRATHGVCRQLCGIRLEFPYASA